MADLSANAQSPLDTFPRNFPIDREVANLLQGNSCTSSRKVCCIPPTDPDGIIESSP